MLSIHGTLVTMEMKQYSRGSKEQQEPPLCVVTRHVRLSWPEAWEVTPLKGQVTQEFSQLTNTNS